MVMCTLEVVDEWAKKNVNRSREEGFDLRQGWLFFGEGF